MRGHAIIILAAVVALNLSCASDDPRKEVEQTRFDTLKKLQAISYHRLGGQAKVDESLFILPNGNIKANSKMYGAAQGTLNEMQQLQLASLFETWDDVKSEYPSPKPSGKPALEEIQYGQKKVIVADDAENIPEELARVRVRLSGMHRDLVKQ